MLEQISSADVILAVREAEDIVKRKPEVVETREAPPGPASGKLKQRLVHGLLIALFFLFCFMPSVVILALIGLGIVLAR